MVEFSGLGPGEARCRDRRKKNRDPWPVPFGLRLGGHRRGKGTGRRGQQEAAAVHHSIT